LSLFSSSSFSSYYYHHHHHLISLSPCSIEDESSLVNCVMSLKWDGARRWNCYFIKRPTRDSIRDFPENYSTFFFFVSFVRSFVRSWRLGAYQMLIWMIDGGYWILLFEEISLFLRLK
jgi:hypothetical protein